MAPRKSAKPVGPKKLWLEHQAALLAQKSDIARVEYALENFHDIRKAKAYEEGGPSKDVSRVPSFTGWKHLKGRNLLELTPIAVYLLGENWDGRKAVSSIFLMSDQVLNLLGIKNYAWNEKWGVGRICLSALTYSGVYYLDRDDYGMNKPYYIYASNKAQIKKEPRPSIKTREEKFPPWTSNVDKFGNKLVRPSHPCLPEKEYVPKFPKDQIVPWLDAVHRLESVRFRINKKLLEYVEETDKKISTRIVPKHLPEKQKKLDELEAGAKRIGLDKLKKVHVKNKEWADYKKKKKLKDVEWRDHKGFSKDGDLEAWNGYWKKYNILHDNIKRYEARRNSFEHHLGQAKLLKDKPFYQRVSVDYRGRLYLPEFSYQGSDFCRAIIEFDSGDVITIDGWKHLLRHTANMRDDDSKATDEKTEAGRSIAPECVEIASDPIKHINKWKDADKPFCFLRSCLEVRDASTPILRYQLVHGDKEQLTITTRQDTVAKAKKWIKDYSANYKELELTYTGDEALGEFDEFGKVVMPVDRRPLHLVPDDMHFVSHMPVSIDQNNSAFQHISFMMDDDALKADTGLSGNFIDIYQQIADQKRIPRKIVKLAIVPWSYGAGRDTIVKRVREYVDESPDKVPDLAEMTGEEIGNLIERVISIFETRFDGCQAYKEQVYDAIKTLADRELRNRPEFIQWRTPFDFVVHQRVHRIATPQRKVANGFGHKDVDLQARQPTDAIDWRGMKTKAPPNLVHSYDAALIHGTLWSQRFYVGMDEHGNRTAYSNQALDNYDIGGDPKEPHGSKPWIGPIITVHDSFACHASDLEELSQDLLHNLEQIYNDFDPFRIFMRDIRGSNQRERKREFKYQESNEWAG